MEPKPKRASSPSTPEQPSKVMKTDVIEADDFDVESENPFSVPRCGSDVALVVEGKKLHVHKCVLSLSSPVFRAMFTSNFSEKDASEIPLLTKTYDAVLNFLLHLYPVYSLKDIADAIVLTSILPLAHEYQAKHVLLKCTSYIKAAISKLHEDKSSLIFLFLCEKYNVLEQYNAALQKAALCHIEDVEKNVFFKRLSISTQMQLLKEKCRNADRSCFRRDYDDLDPYAELEAKILDVLNL